jgi:RHS repeat-associated protein
MTITNYYVASDAMGSTTSILDEEGTVLERRSYDAFGEMNCMTPDGTTVAISPTGVDLSFQGQIRDDFTGVYQMGYRWYHPALGRWLSNDPIGLLAGINSKSAFHNSPTLIQDPDGLGGPENIIPSELQRFGKDEREKVIKYLAEKYKCDPTKQKEDLKKWEKGRGIRRSRIFSGKKLRIGLSTAFSALMLSIEQSRGENGVSIVEHLVLPKGTYIVNEAYYDEDGDLQLERRYIFPSDPEYKYYKKIDEIKNGI